MQENFLKEGKVLKEKDFVAFKKSLYDKHDFLENQKKKSHKWNKRAVQEKFHKKSWSQIILIQAIYHLIFTKEISYIKAQGIVWR